jgi:hypothetical protein
MLARTRSAVRVEQCLSLRSKPKAPARAESNLGGKAVVSQTGKTLAFDLERTSSSERTVADHLHKAYRRADV